MLCSLCAPAKGGGVPVPCGRGCARTAQTPPSSNRRGSAKKIILCAVSGQPPPQRQTLCMHPPPPPWSPLQPKSRRYMPSRDPDPAALGEWLVKQGKAAVGPTHPSLHSNNIQHLPQHPPPRQQQTRRRNRSAAPLLESSPRSTRAVQGGGNPPGARGGLTTRCARGAGCWGRGKTPGNGVFFFFGAAFVVAARCARGARAVRTPPPSRSPMVKISVSRRPTCHAQT